MIEKALTEGLAHQDYRIRMCTIHTLADQEQAEAAQLILPLLHDREMHVR